MRYVSRNTSQSAPPVQSVHDVESLPYLVFCFICNNKVDRVHRSSSQRWLFMRAVAQKYLALCPFSLKATFAHIELGKKQVASS